jgi:hypothetical protein
MELLICRSALVGKRTVSNEERTCNMRGKLENGLTGLHVRKEAPHRANFADGSNVRTAECTAALH